MGATCAVPVHWGTFWPMGLELLGRRTHRRLFREPGDRFVAALDLKPEQPAFRLVYLVRAVTPGDYAMPGAYVEDMYSPNLFARGPAGRLVVGAE